MNQREHPFMDMLAAHGLAPLCGGSEEAITCPACNGKRRGMVHVNSSLGHRWEEQDCSTCKGVGVVHREHSDRIEEGHRRREDRKSRLLTLRQEAERLGITPQELSRIENGRKS